MRQSILTSRSVGRPLAFATLLVVGHWLAVVFMIRPGMESVILHYNAYFGIDQIGSWYAVFVFPAVATSMTILNGSIAYFLARRSALSARFLLIGAVFLNLLLMTATALIYVKNLL